MPIPRTCLCALVAAALAFAAGSAGADIYKYVDKYGRVTLTDRPEHSGYKLVMRTRKAWTDASGRVDYRNMERNREKYTPAIRAAAQRYALPEALLHAVIMAESAYDSQAVSTAGAVGLMQLMPDTAQRYGVGNRRDAHANINGGTRYLRDLLAMFDNNVLLALAAYNAGEGAVIEYGRKIPPYDETRQYVRKVIGYYQEYRKATPS